MILRTFVCAYKNVLLISSHIQLYKEIIEKKKNKKSAEENNILNGSFGGQE
jgi:hypothetical protein